MKVCISIVLDIDKRFCPNVKSLWKQLLLRVSLQTVLKLQEFSLPEAERMH